MSYNVTGLPAYVEQHKSDLLYQVVFGGNTIRRMAKQTGVKGTSTINMLSTDIPFQNGAGCGFTPQGEAKLTQRQIVTGRIKIDTEFCPDNLVGKYNEYLVRVNAHQTDLPFEEEIMASIIDGIRVKMEKAVWQGDTSSSDATLKQFDGLLKALDNASGVIKEEVSAGSAYEAIKAVYMAIPEHLLSKPNVKINVSPAVYRQFLLEMVEKNLYHYSGAQGEFPVEFVFPGTNVAVALAEGLAGTQNIVAAQDSNLVYGCDMEGDMEDLKLWFSDDNDVFRLKGKWNAGVNVAFPDEVVLATIA